MGIVFERKKLDLNAEYQREYVWKEKQQQEFLNAIVKGMPLSAIYAAKDDGVFQYEIVDGKQRLTTLQLFVTNQITIKLESEKVLFSQLSPAEQNSFLNFSLPMILLQKQIVKHVFNTLLILTLVVFLKAKIIIKK